MPISSMPMRMASRDAAGTPLRNASMPRRKSRWSKSRSAVACVGKPSLNSSVPIRVSTRSGVMIFVGIGVLNPAGASVMSLPLWSRLPDCFVW